MRIALGIEYDGYDFHGWQYQRGERTVQDCLQNALSRIADEPVRVTCAGRTDAGVHATGQVVHFDTDASRTCRSWVLGTNTNLPRDIAVCWAHEVDEGFDARFRATQRSYRYVILNRAIRPSLLQRHVCWEHGGMDEQLMAAAAATLLGEHDFTSYRAMACQAKHAVRTLRRLAVSREGEFVYLDVTANAFLHHMVRNLAGVLIAIGQREQPVSWARDVLEARDRTTAGVTAPANGLYMVDVCYPEKFALPQTLRVPRFS